MADTNKLVEQLSGLSVLEIQGVSFDPLGWRWRFSSDTDVNYLIAAKKLRGRARR